MTTITFMSPFADKPRPDTVSVVTLADGSERVVWRQGSGRPVLLIQGMSGSHYEWGDDFVGALESSGRELIGINHRGVCQEAVPAGGYTIADLADDQAQVLDLIGITEPIDVFGTSMGGMVAQELALRHPEKVRTHPREHLRRWRRDDPARSRGPDRPVRGADVRRRGARGPLRLRALQRAGVVRDSRQLRVLRRPRQDLPHAVRDAPHPARRGRWLHHRRAAPLRHRADGDRARTIDRIMPFPNAAPLQAAIPDAELIVFEEAGTFCTSRMVRASPRRSTASALGATTASASA